MLKLGRITIKISEEHNTRLRKKVPSSNQRAVFIYTVHIVGRYDS
jgi:hypothetical protein